MDQVGFWKLTACVDSTGRPGCSQLQCGHTVQVTLPSVLQSNIFFIVCIVQFAVPWYTKTSSQSPAVTLVTAGPCVCQTTLLLFWNLKSISCLRAFGVHGLDHMKTNKLTVRSGPDPQVNYALEFGFVPAEEMPPALIQTRWHSFSSCSAFCSETLGHTRGQKQETVCVCVCGVCTQYIFERVQFTCPTCSCDCVDATDVPCSSSGAQTHLSVILPHPETKHFFTEL